ncbi:MAG: flagellar hook-length control protein FliK [Nitrospirales bacterium]|nr:flagellar hook-length control protein FliK [Nitrospirales bacterium]
MAMDMIQVNVVSTMQGAAGSAGASSVAVTTSRGGEELPAQGGDFVAMLKAALAGKKDALSALQNGFVTEKDGKVVFLDSRGEDPVESGEIPFDGEVAVLVQQLMAQMQRQGSGAVLPAMPAVAPPGMQEEPAGPGTLSGRGDAVTTIRVRAGETPSKGMNMPAAFSLPAAGPDAAQGEAAALSGSFGETGDFRFEAKAAREVPSVYSALPEDSAAPLKTDPPVSRGKDSLMPSMKMQAREGDVPGASLQAAGVKPGNDSVLYDTDAPPPAAVTLSAALPAEARGKGGTTVHEALPLHRVNELGEAAAKAAETGTRNLIVKLDPPDLGSIQIKLRMENGVLTADIRVESSAVKDMFSLAVPQIRASLEDSGIRVGDMWVDHKEEFYSDGRERQGQADQQQNRQQKQDREENPRFFEYFA